MHQVELELRSLPGKDTLGADRTHALEQHPDHERGCVVARARLGGRRLEGGRSDEDTGARAHPAEDDGGMGTVLGVLVGATILKLLPEKLREVNDYRLLMFGLLLVVMMRFRPEGLIASKRRQLEFHEDDEELSELLQAEHLQEAK